MTKYSLLLALAALTIVVTGCKSGSKAVSTATYQKDSPMIQRFENLVSTYSQWNTFSTSGKVDIDGAMSFSSSMQMKMVRGKSITISLRPLLGIEAGKILITSDSIFIVNKLEKYYIAENLSLISNGIPMNINDVQDIFLSHLFILGEGTMDKTSSKTVDIAENHNGEITVSPQRQYHGFRYSFVIDKNNQLASVNVAPANASTTYSVNYGNYTFSPSGKIATLISIATKLGNSNFSLKLDYNSSKISWNAPINDDLTINQNYKRVSGKALFSKLGSM